MLPHTSYMHQANVFKKARPAKTDQKILLLSGVVNFFPFQSPFLPVSESKGIGLCLAIPDEDC